MPFNPWKIDVQDDPTGEKYESELKSRADLAFDLYYRPGAISFLELDYDEIGKKVERVITHRTSLYFLFLFLMVLSTIYFWPLLKENFWYSTIYLVAALPILFKILLRLHFYKGLKNSTDEKEFFKTKIRALNVNKYSWFKFLLFFDYIKPFSIRQIWFWTLIIGLVLASKEYFGKLDFKGNLNYEQLSTFLEDFLRYIIISIVAFIATNVIRELLSVKQKYEEGINSIKNVTSEIQKKFDNLRTEINHTLEVVHGVKPLLDLNSSAPLLISDSNRNYNNFITKIISFVKNIGEYIKGLTDKLSMSKNVDDTSKIALAVSLEGLVNNSKNKLIKDNLILTNFANLGFITSEIFKNTIGKIEKDKNEELEYYALQIKSPLKYINYPFINGASPDEKKYWDTYLCTNIEYAKKGNNILRYFVAIDHNDLSELESSSDGRHFSELGDLIFTKELKWKLHHKVFDVNLQNIKEENNSIGQIIPNFDRINFDNLVYKNGEEESVNDFKSAAEVLDEVIHKKNNCRIRRFDKEEIKNLLLDLPFAKSERKSTFKPFDYLAFRRKKDYNLQADWNFCLETLYDEDLDTAQIRIFYEEEVRDGDKYIWKSCNSCEYKSYGDKKICIQKCWENSNSEQVETTFNQKIINRKLKLNKIFFGNPFIVEIPDDENQALLANGLGKCNIVYNNGNDDFPINGTVSLRRNIIPIIDFK